MHLRDLLGPGEDLMAAGDVFGLVLSVAVFVYLLYALFRGERF
jgi:K+-transporting ATPase KdpF subunit